jgi:hypothetical protein
MTFKPSEFPRTLFIGNPVNEGNRKGRSATSCPGATTASFLGWQDEIPRGDWMRRLIINAILGVILLFLTNLVLAEDIPINLLTVIICAIGGVIGWLVILLLHLLGVAF